MKQHIQQLPWGEPGWFQQASAWIHSQLAASRRHPTAPIEILHQRPWSTFARIATDKGMVFFKAPAPVFSYEAALTQIIAQYRPDCTVPVLAVNLERGWFLSADAGVTVRSQGQSADQIEHWLKILPFYAQFQMEMAEHVPELLASGIHDRRLPNLPILFSTLLQAGTSLRVGLQSGLTSAEYDQLAELSPQLTTWCRQLADYGIPATLTHEKVHDANVLVSGDRYIFTDWSDSSIAHPFFSMLVTLRTVVYWLKMDSHGSEVKRLLEAYLEPWSVYASSKELMDAYQIAERLGMLNRALFWHFSLENVPLELKLENADAVPEWLQDFLNAD